METCLEETHFDLHQWYFKEGEEGWNTLDPQSIYLRYGQEQNQGKDLNSLSANILTAFPKI